MDKVTRFQDDDEPKIGNDNSKSNLKVYFGHCVVCGESISLPKSIDNEQIVMGFIVNHRIMCQKLQVKVLETASMIDDYSVEIIETKRAINQ